MANRERGEVGLDVEGRACVLRYSTNALARYEAAAGENISAVLAALDTGEVSITKARFLVWAGLTDRWPDATIEDAGNVMDEIGLVEILTKAGEAMQLAFPPPPAGANGAAGDDADHPMSGATAA